MKERLTDSDLDIRESFKYIEKLNRATVEKQRDDARDALNQCAKIRWEYQKERDEARSQLECVLDEHAEGAWMARALDAERELTKLQDELAQTDATQKQAFPREVELSVLRAAVAYEKKISELESSAQMVGNILESDEQGNLATATREYIVTLQNSD